MPRPLSPDDDAHSAEWTHHLVFTLYGARIGIRSNQEAPLQALVPVLPPHWRPSGARLVDYLFSIKVMSGSQPVYHLENYDGQSLTMHSLLRLGEYFEREVQLAVALAARGKVFVHAGVVGWHGRAIIIPGKSFSGKSSLVRALVEAGATYYSDEYAVFDRHGRVHPFARPLSVRDVRHVNRKLPPAELRGGIGHESLPVALVMVTHYRARARWRPQTLTAGQGVLELLANTVTSGTRSREVLEILVRVTASAQVLKGVRGEAGLLAPGLLRRLDA